MAVCKHKSTDIFVVQMLCSKTPFQKVPRIHVNWLSLHTYIGLFLVYLPIVSMHTNCANQGVLPQHFRSVASWNILCHCWAMLICGWLGFMCILLRCCFIFICVNNKVDLEKIRPKIYIYCNRIRHIEE